MTYWNLKSKRSTTGKKLKRHCKKKKHQSAKDYIPIKISRPKSRNKQKRGGKITKKLLSTMTANVSANGKTRKTKILDVIENKANMQYVRRKIITKGAVIETELGRAVITNKPAHDNTVNAKLIEHLQKDNQTKTSVK